MGERSIETEYVGIHTKLHCLGWGVDAIANIHAFK